MSGIPQAIGNCLNLRRALGYKLQLHEALLENFASYLEAQGANSITTELAFRWATQPVGLQPVHWARQFGVVKGFAQFLSASIPAIEVQPPDLLRTHLERKSP